MSVSFDIMSKSTLSSDGPQCPYCGRQYPCDEGYYFDALRYTEEICDNCGKKFSVEVQTSTIWRCEQIEGV